MVSLISSSPQNYTLKKIYQVYQEAQQELRKANIDLPQLEARILCSDILDIPSQNIFIQEEKYITKSQYKRLKKMIKLKKEGMPTAYIIGKKEFFNNKFFVNENVLIPRPETEELIEWIITQEQQEQQEKHIDSFLDICCGSGCIGISLLIFHPNLKFSFLNEIIFSDISPDALQVAKKNTEDLLYKDNIKIKFICSDFFNEIRLQKFNLIVSNPPYVSQSEMKNLMPSVKNYEPNLALEIPREDFISELIHEVYDHLENKGRFYMECNPLFILEIREEMLKTGFKKVEIKTDLSGKNRFIKGIR